MMAMIDLVMMKDGSTECYMRTLSTGLEHHCAKQIDEIAELSFQSELCVLQREAEGA